MAQILDITKALNQPLKYVKHGFNKINTDMMTMSDKKRILIDIIKLIEIKL